MNRKKAIGYIRVSTEMQSDDGISIDAQQAKLHAYAELYDIDLVEMVVDAGESAKSLQRPGLQRALEMLKRGEADALIVMKLDRLTRSVADLGVLVERYFKTAALLSVSEQIDTRSAAGRLVLNVLASVAQWEREAIGERTSEAMQHKKSQGLRVGSIPYGYRLDDDGATLVEDEDEQRVIAMAQDLKGRGMSLRAVSSRLEKAGHTSRNGKPFHARQVSRLLAA